GRSHVLAADQSLAIDNVEGRPALNVPRGRDGAPLAAAIPKRRPRDMLLFVLLLRLLAILIAVDTDESERLAFQTLHERPLVFKHRPARASPMPPEVEQHHPTAVVAEFEFLAVQ